MANVSVSEAAEQQKNRLNSQPHNIIIITIIFEEIITTIIKQISIKGNLCVLLYI
jgi:hypothetical protein